MLHSFNSCYTDCPSFSTFLTCVWSPMCLSMVTFKYLQWFDFFTTVEPTVTVSKSLRRLSYLREKVLNSVLFAFNFSFLRQKYSANLYKLSCKTSRAVSGSLSLQKIKQRQHVVIYVQFRSKVLEDHSHSS